MRGSPVFRCMKHGLPLALGAIALLAACQAEPASNAAPDATTASTAAPQAGGPTATPTGTPTSPAAQPGEADKGEPGARAVLLDWARAIERKQFDRAWQLMSEQDHAKWSAAQFAQLFAGLGEITVAVPGGTMEGAAGSSFYTSHAVITATDDAGRPVRIEGDVVLRRVDDVPGATPEQLRWHIQSTTLDWTH